MEVTVSYKQIAAIGITVAVIALGIGVIKSGAIPFQQSSQQYQTQTTQTQQEISSYIKELRNDITSLQSSLTNFSNIDSHIETLQNSISNLETRISTTEAEHDKIKELGSYIDTLTQQIAKLKEEIQDLKTSQAEIAKSQESKSIEQTGTEELQEVEKTSQQEESSPSPQPSTSTKSLLLTINRVQYAAGDTVVINVSTDEDASIDIRIVNSDSKEIFKKVVNANSAGKLRVEYLIPSDMPAGGYKVIAAHGDRQKSLAFTVAKLQSPPSASSESGSITIKTDKQTYNKGEYISVSGNAPPRSRVMLILTTPSANESVLTAQADEKGTYNYLIAISLDSRSGEWTITAKQGDEMATLRITIR